MREYIDMDLIFCIVTRVLKVGFLSRFTKWINYEHRVRAQLENGTTTSLQLIKLQFKIFIKRNLIMKKRLKLLLILLGIKI